MFQRSEEDAGEHGAVRGYLSARMQSEGLSKSLNYFDAAVIFLHDCVVIFLSLCVFGLFLLLKSVFFWKLEACFFLSLYASIVPTSMILIGKAQFWNGEPGNLWQELWLSSRPVPALKQSPLFDEELAG